MAKHIFGLTEQGEKRRFYKILTDEQFECLVNGKLNGELPEGVFVWSLEEKDTVHNSEVVREIVSLPIVTGSNGIWTDPVEYLPILKRGLATIAELEAEWKAQGMSLCSKCMNWHRPEEPHLFIPNVCEAEEKQNPLTR